MERDLFWGKKCILKITALRSTPSAVLQAIQQTLQKVRQSWWGGEGARVRGNRAKRHRCSCAGEPGSVQYLPSGPGVQEEDVLDTHTLCCCLKNGLSKRPGKQGDREPREGHTGRRRTGMWNTTHIRKPGQDEDNERKNERMQGGLE